jgi:hypothetical protein
MRKNLEGINPDSIRLTGLCHSGQPCLPIFELHCTGHCTACTVCLATPLDPRPPCRPALRHRRTFDLIGEFQARIHQLVRETVGGSNLFNFMNPLHPQSLIHHFTLSHRLLGHSSTSWRSGGRKKKQ